MSDIDYYAKQAEQWESNASDAEARVEALEAEIKRLASERDEALALMKRDQPDMYRALLADQAKQDELRARAEAAESALESAVAIGFNAGYEAYASGRVGRSGPARDEALRLAVQTAMEATTA